MKKRQKSKMTMLIVGGLTAVSLVSVGFASWVASGSTPATTNDVSVSVGAVTNNSISVTIKDTSDLALAFENVASPSGDVFTNGGDGTEDLRFRIDFEVNGKTSLYDKINFVFSGALTENKYSTYIQVPYGSTPSKTISYSIIWATPSINISNQIVDNEVENTITKNSDTKATISANFNFKWGTAFKGVNPGNLDTNEHSMKKEDIISATQAFHDLLAADIANKAENPLLKVTISTGNV